MKNVFIKLLLITCIALNTAFLSRADSDGGTWKIHNVFNANRTRVVDAGDKVYCVTDNSLNAYDKTSGSWEGLNKLNRLSDFQVSSVYYNSAKDYVVVTYLNYNIDILLSDGRTINIPNLKNMATTAARTINDVTFGLGGIYVASQVGYMVIEDNNFTVTKAAFFNSKVQSVAEVGDRLILCNGSNTYYASIDANVKTMDMLTASSLGISGTLMPIDDSKFFLNQSSKLYVVTIGEGGTFSKTAVSSAKVMDVQATASGFLAVGGTSLTVTTKYYAFDSNGTKTADITLPSTLTNTLLSSCESDGSLWRLGAVGLQHVSLDTSAATTTALADETRPSCVTARRIGALAYNKGNGRMYATSGGAKVEYLIEMYGKTAYISSFDGTSWRDEIPTDMQGYTFRDPYEPVFDHDDPEVFYVGTWYEGVYKIGYNTLLAKYDWDNSPMVKALNNWFCQIPSVQMDSSGNLWTIQYSCGERENDFAVLPRANLSKATELTEADWSVPQLPVEVLKRLVFMIGSDDTKIMYEDGRDNILVFQNDENFNILKSKRFSEYIDQEDKRISILTTFDLEEDKNGIVWIGAYYGLVGLKLSEVFNDDYKVIRPKTNGNDYALDNIGITAISTDDYNRKWMGTMDDGFYLLNEDCTQVLKHFNTANSCLPNDRVYAIRWNPTTQSVFVGFNGGMVEYKPENVSDYSKIAVEPSRITPDFRGDVIIDNVPVGATLYIKNGNGDIVRTITADSSRVYWDCNTEAGSRVETGKYSISVQLSGESSVIDGVISFYVIK